MGEVVWLLALSRKDAIEEDLPGSSLLQPDGGSSETTRVPTLARWSEVRTVRDRVARRKRDVAATELVAQGYSQGEVAALQGVSQQTISRRFRATAEEIVALLNGAPGRTVAIGVAEHERSAREAVRLLTDLAAA